MAQTKMRQLITKNSFKIGLIWNIQKYTNVKDFITLIKTAILQQIQAGRASLI